MNRDRVRHRPNDRELVGAAREPRHQLADLETGNRGRDRPVRPAQLGRGVRLHIPHIEVTRTAIQMNDDAVIGLGSLHGIGVGSQQLWKG